MNERIKTMWVEATGSVWPRPYKFTAGEYDTHLEKFAELIVRECARAVDRVYETAPPDYGCIDWSTIAAGSDVLKHFGVEE